MEGGRGQIASKWFHNNLLWRCRKGLKAGSVHCTTISRESGHTHFFFNSTRELLLGIIKIFFKPFLAKIRIYGKLCCELIKASMQFVQIITSILVVIRLCPETRSKWRSYKSLEREVMCKQERRIVTIRSCESEGCIARDINRERGVWWSGFPNSVTRCRASSLCKHTGSPGRASHCHCQPFKQSSMLNCSSPTYSLILTECNISGKPLTNKLIRSLFRNHSMPSSSEALTR